MRGLSALALVLAVVLLAGCGSSAPRVQTRSRVVPMHVLSAGTSKRALRWFARLRECYRQRELVPARVKATPRRLTLDVDPSVPRSILAGETLSCASLLGKPPAHAAFHTQRGRTVLVPPKGYLFDTKS